MTDTRLQTTDEGIVPKSVRTFFFYRVLELAGLITLLLVAIVVVALASWSVSDPSWDNAIATKPQNLIGVAGANVAHWLLQTIGLGSLVIVCISIYWATSLFGHEITAKPIKRGIFFLLATLTGAAALSLLPTPSGWPLGSGLGGAIGDAISGALKVVLGLTMPNVFASTISFIFFAIATAFCARGATGILNSALMAISSPFGGRLYDRFLVIPGMILHLVMAKAAKKKTSVERYTHEPEAESTPSKRNRGWMAQLTSTFDKPARERVKSDRKVEPRFTDATQAPFDFESFDNNYHETVENFDQNEASEPDGQKPISITERTTSVPQAKAPIQQKRMTSTSAKPRTYQLPPLDLLKEPGPEDLARGLSNDALEQNARMLEGVLEDFGIRGEIINVRPGPVVTLYELEPAPGIKSSRVIGLADDIARSMSAISARVAVVPGRNVIGIELPNADRETVFLRELIASQAYQKSKFNLAVALGKDIGGEPVLSDLARMPHLLIAGTTGSGKSVGINTLILSLLYRLTPEQCKLIMIDPKMLELSVYEGIPHLLAPVVTDPRKAVVALKWTVREMEERYRKMSKMGVRNVDGYNKRAHQALKKGEPLTRTVQTGFDPDTQQPIFEEETLDLSPMPFIVVIIDEMADLMMVAGKEIEGAVQRLAQMARAAGIHVVMATQRPSVDVITGTIKANFPTRISFQVTSKIDSRTILGEQGAENLLGQGDQLYMAGGGRISRLHGAFVSDREVEEIVGHLKMQAAPDYVEAVTEEPPDDPYTLPGEEPSAANSGDELYDKAVAVVLRDKKVSTSYIQRRLQIGYNKAATLIERMEEEGLISSPSQSGKREILVGDSDQVSH